MRRRKIIIIESCDECPYFDTDNEVNVCDHSNIDKPYDIPDLCTLQDYDYVECPR